MIVWLKKKSANNKIYLEILYIIHLSVGGRSFLQPNPEQTLGMSLSEQLAETFELWKFQN